MEHLPKQELRDRGQFSKDNMLKSLMLKPYFCQEFYNYLRYLCYIVVLMCGMNEWKYVMW